MTIRNALAGVATRDIKQAAEWYEKLFGEPGAQPMPNLREWSLPNGGVLQLFEDPERAGKSSVTLSVTKLNDHLTQLANHGILVKRHTNTEAVRTAIIEDPDGNQVVIAEPHSSRVAR